jgi:general secretion pathway protein I
MRILKRRSGGFSLVETLVAFAILAIVTGMVLRATTGALHNSAQAAFQQQAVRLARSHLAMLGITSPVVAGVTRGQFAEGPVWQQNVTVVAGATGPNARQDPVGFWVTVTIKPSGPIPQDTSEVLTVTTFKLAARAP